MPLTSPKLYAGCFGATRGGKNGSGGEDQGVVFVVADQAADVHGREQALYGKKVVGFHYHQVEELSAIKGYTITLEKQEKLPARYLYAVVVTQKLDGLWAVIDRWIEFVAAADDEAAGREALSSARVTTSGKTEMEFCCRLDTVDGYTVVLHEAGK